MQKWTTKNITPPDGWRYLVPDTKVLVKGNHFGHLLAKVEEHMSANGIPVPLNLEEYVENYMCGLFPDKCVEVEVKTQPDKAKKMTVGDVLRFTAMIGADMMNGRKRVANEEANRRANVCASCPDNIDPDGCTGCNRGKMEKLVDALTGSIATPDDSRLKSCRHCGCINRAQVWFPLEILQKFTTKEVNQALPSNCWKKQ
tara:strand:- start:8348 stop:8947 length:600 start_codon:yes stop_codon:yes gene_type:complete